MGQGHHSDVPYTDTDLTAVRTALLQLARGQQVVEVRHGDRTVRYEPADLATLRMVEQDIIRELASTRTRGRQTFAVSTKGF